MNTGWMRVVVVLLALGEAWLIGRDFLPGRSPAPAPAVVDFTPLGRQAAAAESKANAAAWRSIADGLRSGGKMADLVPAAEAAMEAGRKKARGPIFAALSQIAAGPAEPTPAERAELITALDAVAKGVEK